MLGRGKNCIQMHGSLPENYTIMFQRKSLEQVMEANSVFWSKVICCICHLVLNLHTTYSGLLE